VDLANKRRGGCRGKRSSYYMVERTMVFSKCTLPVLNGTSLVLMFGRVSPSPPTFEGRFGFLRGNGTLLSIPT
jgi:hypothetical protein